MMERETKKYKRVRDLLRHSVPVLDSKTELEEKVINYIVSSGKKVPAFPDIIGLLFGWVYIGWIRRSLLALSAALVIFFIYQQTEILRELNYLNSKSIIISRGTQTITTRDIEKRLLMYKLSGIKPGEENIDITRQQVNELIESVNELQDKYRDLINIINSDPGLKKYIEEQLDKKEKSKLNL
jgi:hypothetical protein